VVTTMRIRLHRDYGLVGGMVLFPWEQAGSVLERYADLLADAPDGLTLLMELTVAPGVGPCLMAVPVWSGDGGSADALEQVRGLGSPLSGTVAAVSQQELLQQFDQHVPQGMHWSLRTRSVASLTPEVVELLVSAADRRPGPGAGLGLRHFHGAAARVGADDTAVGLRRDHVLVEISAGRDPAEDPGPYRDWVEEVSASLAPHALPGGYPNFLKPDQVDQVRHAYGQHAGRLMQAKATYDPHQVFTGTPLPEPA
jgi:Berberine and berberine like